MIGTVGRSRPWRGSPAWSIGAPHDGIDIAAEAPRGVLQGLALTHLGAASFDDNGVAAELGNAGIERKPRPSGGLIEEDRHRLALQMAAASKERV